MELARRNEHQLHADRVGDLDRHAEVLGPGLLMLFGFRGVEGGDGGRRSAGREVPFAIGTDKTADSGKVDGD